VHRRGIRGGPAQTGTPDNEGDPVKLIGLKQAKARLSEFVDASQRDRVLITRRGKPVALVIGVEGQDIEQIILGSDPAFWKLIEERRHRTAPTLTSDDIRCSFGIEISSGRRKPRGGKSRGTG
jgi:prevent-host-death family protein